jgi:hypothetical protein
MSEKFEPKDLEDSLRRAFVDKKADFIMVDGHTLQNEFLRESVVLGLEKGLLVQGQPIDEDDRLGRGLGQNYAFTYRLTEEGRKYFGISNQEGSESRA